MRVDFSADERLEVEERAIAEGHETKKKVLTLKKQTKSTIEVGVFIRDIARLAPVAAGYWADAVEEFEARPIQRCYQNWGPREQFPENGSNLVA